MSFLVSFSRFSVIFLSFVFRWSSSGVFLVFCWLGLFFLLENLEDGRRDETKRGEKRRDEKRRVKQSRAEQSREEQSRGEERRGEERR